MIYFLIVLLFIQNFWLISSTIQYNENQSQLSFYTLYKGHYLEFKVSIQDNYGSCRLSWMMAFNDLSTLQTHYGNNSCASLRQIDGSITNNYLTLIFDQLNFTDAEKIFTLTISTMNDGRLSSISFYSPTKQSFPVENLRALSEGSPPYIKLKWNQPKISNGRINQYRVVIKLSFNNSCSYVGNMTFQGIYQLGSQGQTECESYLYIHTIGTFYSSTLFDVIISNGLKPWEFYYVAIQPVNRWGYGLSASTTVRLNEYRPESPSFVRYNAEFPSGKLSVYVKPTSIPNGDVFQYILRAISADRTHCILWIYNCSSCSNQSYQTNGSPIEDCKLPNAITIRKTVAHLSDILIFEAEHPQHILPYTSYSLQSQAFNGWGYGLIETKTFTTPHYKSSRPDQISVTSTESDKLKLQLKKPQQPNGQIYKYIVLLKDSQDNCVNIWIGECYYCRNQNLSENGNRIDGNCLNKSNIEYFGYHQGDKINFQNSSPRISLFTNYSVTVQPVNGWGYGESISKSFVTRQGYPAASSFVGFNDEFPLGKLSITLKRSSMPDGQVFQHIVKLTSIDHCIIWQIYCSRCYTSDYQDKGSQIPHCEFPEIISQRVDAFTDILSLNVTSSSFIRPYVTYTLTSQAVNGLGYGISATNTFISSQYKSSPPILVYINYQFQNFDIGVSFPKSPNGVIHRFHIGLFIGNLCMAWTLNYRYNPNSIGHQGESIFKDRMCILNETHYFYSFQRVSVLSNNLLIIPFTKYTVKLQAVNLWGYGDILQFNYTTNQYQSGPPQLNFIKLFIGNRKFHVSWADSAKSNGPPSKYLMLLLTDDGICTNKWYIGINQYSDQIAGNNGNRLWLDRTCTKQQFLHLSQLEVISNDHELFSNTSTNKYQLVLLSANKWGWSDILTQKFSTVATKPGPVNNFNCKNIGHFGIQCHWQDPILPNGVMEGVTLDCGPGHVYNRSISVHSIEITENIKDNSQYFCKINSWNNNGYGEALLFNVTIPVSPFIELKDIKSEYVNKLMNSSKSEVTDASTQIAMTIPLGLFQSAVNVIEKVTLAVAYGKRGKTKSILDFKEFFDKSYSECLHAASCVYEILVYNNQKKVRREATALMTDRDFIIGSDKTCAWKSQYLCNGPLIPSTNYQLSLRIYSKKAFVSYGDLSIKTKPKADITKWIVLGFVVLVVLLVLLGIIIYIHKKPGICKNTLKTNNLKCGCFIFKKEAKQPNPIQEQNDYLAEEDHVYEEIKNKTNVPHYSTRKLPKPPIQPGIAPIEEVYEEINLNVNRRN